MQGVSINYFVKTGKKKQNELGEIFHYDLYGKREYKYDFLSNNSIKSIAYKKLPNVAPDYFFQDKDFGAKEEYDEGFEINKIFKINGSGIVSKRDSLAFQNSKNEIIEKVKDIHELSPIEIKNKYSEISWDSRDGKVEYCKKKCFRIRFKR